MTENAVKPRFRVVITDEAGIFPYIIEAPDAVAAQKQAEFEHDNRDTSSPNSNAPAALTRVVPGRERRAVDSATDMALKTALSVRGLRRGIGEGFDAAAQNIPRALGAAADLAGLDKTAKYFRGDTKILGADVGAGAVDQTILDNEQAQKSENVARGIKPGYTDWTRTIGSGLGYVPFGLGSMAPKTALSAAGSGILAGAKAGALTPVVDEEDQQQFGLVKAGQVGLGAGAGGVLGPVTHGAIKGVKALYSAAVPYVDAIRDAITGKGAERLSQAVQAAHDVIKSSLKEIGLSVEELPAQQYKFLHAQVVEALSSRTRLDPAALLRKAEFDSFNIPSTKGQLTRDPAQYAFEQNVRGQSNVGEPLMEVFNAQGKRFTEILDTFAKDGGVDVATVGQKLGAFLSSLDEAAREKVSALYGVASKSHGKTLDVPTGGLVYDVSNTIKDFGEKVPGAILARLKSYGMLGEKQTSLFDFEEADKFLKVINQHVGHDPTTNTALRQLREAVKRAMTDTPAPDVFAAGREAAKNRFRSHEDIAALGAAADNSLVPDKFIQQYVVSSPTADSIKLAKFLQKTSPELFEAAKAELGAVIKRAAFGENPAEDAVMKPASLAKILRVLGPKKLEAWFGAEMTADLSKLARVGGWAISTPGRAAVSTSSSNIASSITAYAGDIARYVPALNKIKALSSLYKEAKLQGRVNEAAKGDVPRIDVPESVAEIDIARLVRALTAQGPAKKTAEEVLGLAGVTKNPK